MQTGAPNADLNEIQFLSRREFQQMAPSILQLEITRLTKVIERLSEGTDVHNSLVRARFELVQFVLALQRASIDSREATLADHLRVAILNLVALPEGLDAETRTTCRYVLERLDYLEARIALIY